MSEPLKLVNLPATNLKNVAANLRNIADCVESWKDTALTAVVIVLRDSQAVQVHAYGSRASGLEVQGIITRAGFSVGKAINSFEEEK